jgi:hypothetical protein
MEQDNIARTLQVAEYRQQIDFHRQQIMVLECMVHELESPDSMLDQEGNVISYADFLNL